MTRQTAVLAVVALMVVGTGAALAGSAPTATDGVPMAQDTETTTAADGNETETDDEATTAMAGETTTAVNQMDVGITVLNQTGNGSVVMVERAVLPEGGFVVIHEAQNVTGDYATAENVSVGAVVGNSSYLESGAHSNVRIELNQTFEEGQTFVAMLHQDTNDNQRYEFPEADGPYTMNGSPVIETAYFIISPEGGETAGIEASGNWTADITFEEQEGNGTTVTLNSVNLSEGGFVSIRSVENGTVGDVVGNTSYLEAGNYTDLQVELDRQMSESGQLVAVAHPDRNENQVFDFPGPDAPYRAAGGTLSDPAYITVPGPGEASETTTATGNESMGNETTTTEM